MTNTHEIEKSANSFVQILEAATKMPGVRINRADYLSKQLKRHCTEKQIAAAIETSPAEAGIPTEVIKRIASASISYETKRVVGLSFAAGLPGGPAMIATVPIDASQFMAHQLRIVQKLAYIYSWPDIFGSESDSLDDEAENMLILFLGVMFGVQAANTGVNAVAGSIAANAVRQLPRMALTRGTIFPLVQTVLKKIGIRLTVQNFTKGVGKTVPVVGAVFSGGITWAAFQPMSKRLEKHLAELELTKPREGADKISDLIEDDVIDAEVVENNEPDSSEWKPVEKDWKSKLPKISRRKRKDDDAS